MQLVMFIGNDFIASVGVDAHQISLPGYVGTLKRRLLEENSQYLATSSEAPVFLVADFSGDKCKKEKKNDQ